MANEIDEAFLDGVRLGVSARESGEAAANYRADMAAKGWNEMNELIAEASQKIVDLRAALRAMTEVAEVSTRRLHNLQHPAHHTFETCDMSYCEGFREASVKASQVPQE